MKVSGVVVKLLQQFQRKFMYIVVIHKLSSKLGVCGRLIIPSMCSMHDQTSSVDPVAVTWTCQDRCIYLTLACMTSNAR